MMKKVLTIAGSDSGGGAGIQADLKTFMAHGVYGSSAITAVTAQNTLGVLSKQCIAPDILRDQIVAVFSDLRPDAVKIGMIANSEQVRIITNLLQKYQASHVVIDPVMMASSGEELLMQDAMSILYEELFPVASLITPNRMEALRLYQCITGKSEADVMIIGEVLQEKCRTNVLIKGGHSDGNDTSDVLFTSDGKVTFPGVRIDNPNTHGTGCTLSSAVAANLAIGYTLTESIEKAKRYTEGCIEKRLNLGEGSGPMDHRGG